LHRYARTKSFLAMTILAMTKRLTCWSCRHSAGHIGGALRCMLHERWAIRVCKSFEYEAGTDEHERIAEE